MWNYKLKLKFRAKIKELFVTYDIYYNNNNNNSNNNNNTHCNWCTWNYLGEWKGLVWEVESTRYFCKRTVVSHPWGCLHLAESVMSLSCGSTAETWLRIPRKRTGEDHNTHKYSRLPVTRTLYNLCLTLTRRSNFHFPSDRFLYSFTLDNSNSW